MQTHCVQSSVCVVRETSSVPAVVFTIADEEQGIGYEMQVNGSSADMVDDASDDGAGTWLLSGSAADKVRFILSPEGVEGSGGILIAQHSIFCQMDLLCHFDNGEMGWKETARFVFV
jgi:hypothetical protein